MLTRIGQILLFGVVVVGIGCQSKQEPLLKQKSPVIRGDVDVVKKEGKAESTEQIFERLLLQSNDDTKTYRLLRIIASMLHGDEQTIVLAEKALEQIRGLEDDLKKDASLLGEDANYPERLAAQKKAEVIYEKIRDGYSRLAILYNKKMAELNFKFTEPTGLPPGQTETLPRVFPIR